MASQYARFEEWFERRRGPREPELEAALLVVADAYDAVKESGELRSEQLRLIVEAASSSRALLWMNAVELLGALSNQWATAADAVLEMSKNRKANVRFNALCCLQSGTPDTVTDPLLRAGLIDKSSRVRWKAADRTESLGKVDLIPELSAAMASEQDAKTRKTIEFHLLLLRDGYILEPRPNGGFQVTARTPRGCTGRTITSDELRSKGIDAIVSELQEWSNRH